MKIIITTDNPERWQHFLKIVEETGLEFMRQYPSIDHAETTKMIQEVRGTLRQLHYLQQTETKVMIDHVQAPADYDDAAAANDAALRVALDHLEPRN